MKVQIRNKSRAQGGSTRRIRPSRSTIQPIPPNPEQEARRRLALTLRRAAEIAEAKAQESSKNRQRETRASYTLLACGAFLIILGVMGTLLAVATGMVEWFGLVPTTLFGILSVAAGAILLVQATESGSNEQPVYAQNARQLAQMSTSLKRAQ